MIIARKIRIQNSLRFFNRKLPVSSLRTFSDEKKPNDEEKKDFTQFEDPIKRTGRILKNDLLRAKYWVQDLFKDDNAPRRYTMPLEKFDAFIENREDVRQFQTHCDILVIGGGGMGASIAYWLKKRAREGLNVVVLEKDPTYQQCSTTLSVGGLRQQFSLPENIQMSLYGADFIRRAKEHLGNDVDVNFQPFGYLMLATEEGAQTLKENSRLQNELGARNEILTTRRLKEKFPWLNTDGIAMGCHGLEKEGWFDPWALLTGFKKRSIEYGAHYLHGEAVGFEFKHQPDMVMEGVTPGQYQSLDRVLAKLPNGEVHPIKFAICIIAGECRTERNS